MNTKLLTCFCMLSCLAISQFVSAENWNEFRGPTGQGIATNADLPIRWSEQENVRWFAKVDGKGWSSPVVSNDKIYVTTAASLAVIDSDLLLRSDAGIYRIGNTSGRSGN